MSRASSAAGVLVVVACLAGCVRLGQPAPRIEHFRLDYTATPPEGPPLPYILRVPPMEVAATYDRDPIVYREGEYRIGSYFYDRWASNPGNMIADLLARDLVRPGLYRDVQTAVSLVAPDFQVKGTVEEIEERIDGTSCSARLSLRVTLAGTRGAREERVRFSKLYSATEPAKCDDPDSLAQAMSAAMATLSGEIQADVYAALRGGGEGGALPGSHG